MKRRAGFWVRFAANLIDWILLSVASTLLELAILGGLYWVRRLLFGGAAPFWDAFDPFLVQGLNSALYLSLAIIYYGWGHYRWGTTPGKYPLNIHVVDAETGGPLTLSQSLLRCFGYVLSYASLGGGFLMAGLHPDKRALHDLIARSVCVRRKTVIQP